MTGEAARIKELQERIAFYEDMKAYEQLYDLLFNGLNRFCHSFVGSREASEEIVSDAFIKLWQIRNRLPEIENLKLYLYRIARNFSCNYITKNYKNRILSLDEMELETAIALGDPEEICISADALNRIQEAIGRLPPQCRVIFQLVKEEGLKYKEVAEILHVSVFTVRNQVAIATKKIATLLPASLQPKENSSRKFSDS